MGMSIQAVKIINKMQKKEALFGFNQGLYKKQKAILFEYCFKIFIRLIIVVIFNFLVDVLVIENLKY
jgi:hypothetical protein